MSALEASAVQRVIAMAVAADLPEIAAEARGILCSLGSATIGRHWVALHPDADPIGCCYGDAEYGTERCTCWEPVFGRDQLPARPPAQGDTIDTLPAMTKTCHDCAYRKGSVERQDDYMAETLLDLALCDQPFWCHQGMRRPGTTLAFWRCMP